MIMILTHAMPCIQCSATYKELNILVFVDFKNDYFTTILRILIFGSKKLT